MPNRSHHSPMVPRHLVHDAEGENRAFIGEFLKELAGRIGKDTSPGNVTKYVAMMFGELREASLQALTSAGSKKFSEEVSRLLECTEREGR